MIVLTLAGDADGEDLFINPTNIIGVCSNDEGSTDVVCVDQTIFVVKETPIEVCNRVAKNFN